MINKNKIKGLKNMIRFKIDVMQELKNKGYPANKLRNDISYHLSESTMQNIRTARKNNSAINITTKAINIICEILKKQPGQILEWIPDGPPATDQDKKTE